MKIKKLVKFLIIPLLLFVIGCSVNGPFDSTNSKSSSSTVNVESFSRGVGVVNLTKNPYSGVNWSTYKQYKANYHAHTTNSDGKSSPTALINEYYSKGYSILSIADHNYTTWPWPHNPGMLAIKGNEYSSSHHMNAMLNFTTSRSNLESGIPHVQSKGGLVQIHHPGRHNSSSNWSWYLAWFKDYSAVTTLEVFNQGDRYPNDRKLWDSINENLFPQTGKFAWGSSNDDKHSSSHLYGNFNFMLMPNLTEASFKESLTKGAFYFSYEPGRSGNANVPRISNIVVDNNAKTITITASGYSKINWIGPGSTVVGTGNVFNYSNYTNKVFVRAVLDGPSGDSYTQPFGFETTSGGNIPPTCSITAPANNANFTAPGKITISASAKDSDGSITKVEFYNGSTKLGEDTTYPYSFTWSNVSVGNYKLTVKATDNGGASTTSSAVTVNVNSTSGYPAWVKGEIYVKGDRVTHIGKNWECGWYTTEEPGTTGQWGAWQEITGPNPIDKPPVVSITTNGTQFKVGDVVTITADATDDSAVASVEFFAGATSLGVDTTVPYSVTLNYSSPVSVKAVAKDDAAQSTTSNAVELTTAGTGPVVDPWAAGVSYNVGDVVSYGGSNWVCSTAHTSNSAWYPGAPGLWFWKKQ